MLIVPPAEGERDAGLRVIDDEILGRGARGDAMSDNPFPLPGQLDAPLARVADYWRGLKRAGNEMPFWDDLNLSSLPDLADRLLLIDVFDGPERFRFNTVGKAIAGEQGRSYHGKFLDEVALSGCLAFLRAQASATVEARVPTCHRGSGFSRILLPMWGDGRIGMLLGAVELR
jgi:hypothetical protein